MRAGRGGASTARPPQPARALLRAAVVAVAVAGVARPAGAQTTPGAAAPPAPQPADAPASLALRQAVLTVDQEALYAGSAWGRRSQAEIEALSAQVSADNDRAFADLSAEEEALTEARATLPPDAFRARATAFDERVTQVRREREAAARSVALTAENDRQRFFQAAAPVLGRVMKDRGALLVLDQRTVLFSDASIDVTAEVIARLDADLGDGAAGTESGPDRPDGVASAGPAGGTSRDSADPAPQAGALSPPAGAAAPADVPR